MEMGVVEHVGKGITVESEKKYIGGCAWQKHYNENVVAKCQLLCR